MNIALRKPMMIAEFLAWEERQDLRYEFDGFQPVAMTGGTANHETIVGNLRATLRERLRGKPCRPWGPTIKIEVMGRIRYPDVFVNCTPVTGKQTVIPGPAVVFEVLSPSTSHTDRIEKLREYQATPSIQRYVILEQDAIAATVLARQGESWIANALTAGETLEVPEIGISLPLTDIYADVVFEPAADGDSEPA